MPTTATINGKKLERWVAFGRQPNLRRHELGNDGRWHEIFRDIQSRFGTGCFLHANLRDLSAHDPEQAFSLRLEDTGSGITRVGNVANGG